jgi:hypothetical protein
LLHHIKISLCERNAASAKGDGPFLKAESLRAGGEEDNGRKTGSRRPKR